MRRAYAALAVLVAGGALLFQTRGAETPHLLHFSHWSQFSFHKLFAPVIVNVELDKTAATAFVLASVPDGNDAALRPHRLQPTDEAPTDLKNTVVSAEIKDGVRDVFLCTRDSGAVPLIDNISVFIGPKCFYFPGEEAETWPRRASGAMDCFRPPLPPLSASIFQSRLNWRGDLNWILTALRSFVLNPFAFPVASLCLLSAVALLRREFGVLSERAKNRLEILLLCLLTLFALALRLVFAGRHSAWADELYSAVIASNPALPFGNAWDDPGDPPLYFMLLRLWFQLFGWDEATGRALGVVLGCCGVAAGHFFVRALCGRKAGLLCAFLLTISTAHIGYSAEIRGYALQMLLVPLAARNFFLFLEKGRRKDLLLYALFGVLAVNTHYYCVLFVASNFAYYFVHARRERRGPLRAGPFVAASLGIACSLLPFFLMVAPRALNPNYDAWIPAPSAREFAFCAALAAACAALALTREKLRNCSPDRGALTVINYALFTTCLVFAFALCLSLFRPILTWRYLALLLPLVFAAAPFVFCCGRLKNMLFAAPVLLMCHFADAFTEFGFGAWDVYREAEEYIVADAARQAERNGLSAVQLRPVVWPGVGRDFNPFYGLDGKIRSLYPELPGKPGEPGRYDIAYINPTQTSMPRMYAEILRAGLDARNVLKIRTNDGKFIFKAQVAKQTPDGL
ncbi:MAG: glycosyltransferase family 39 protein [Desulfovibrio sp.]|nr:glycosyltransferase family 39 protein [Desulfovibrio sp.]